MSVHMLSTDAELRNISMLIGAVSTQLCTTDNARKEMILGEAPQLRPIWRANLLEIDYVYTCPCGKKHKVLVRVSGPEEETTAQVSTELELQNSNSI